MKKSTLWIIATVIAVAVVSVITVSAFTVNAPAPKSTQELIEMQGVFDTYPINDEITVVNLGELSLSERHSLIILQGLVSREKPALFIDYGTNSHRYTLEELEKSGYTVSRTDEEGNPWRFASVVRKFASFIEDSGYILFSTVDDHGQLNTATNLATINGWLPVTPENEEAVIALGMKKCADISKDTIDNDYIEDFYNEHKDFFRKDSLVHLYCYASGLRDFAVQQKIFTMYVDDSDVEGRSFRTKVFRDLEPASVILGWCQYEIKFTRRISRFGHSVIPSDHSYNLSFLSSFNADKKAFDTDFPEQVTVDKNKHYVAIVYSDGDNLQWIQNGYSEFHTWQSYESDLPVSWTFAPIASELSPVDITITLNNGKDVPFIAGPSGGGYARISEMNEAELEAFSDYTAALMLESGLDIITFLDEVRGVAFDTRFHQRLAYFSRYDNIRGGIIQLDPDRYAAGAGKVFFSDDKPFVTIGFSLWHPSGNADEVNEEWLKEQAEIINEKKADITSINGYTVINVHPWTVGPDDLKYFTEQLGDNIEVIGVNELLAAIKQNIPHETATPQ